MAKSPPPPLAPHPENAPGDFYVEDGCCITCGIPLSEAPEVFDWAKGGNHCIVARQPQSSASVTRTLRAMTNAEVDCIRYRGTDPQVGRRLVEIGLATSCDLAPPPDAKPIVRSHVSFRITDGSARYGAAQLAHELLEHIGRHFEGQRYYAFEAKPVRGDAARAAIEFAWILTLKPGDAATPEAKFKIVEFETIADGEWLARTKPEAIGLSDRVDGWLRAAARFQDIRWFSTEQWCEGGPYSSTVI